MLDGVGDVAAKLFEMRFGDSEFLLRIEKRDQFTPADLQGGDLCSEGLDRAFRADVGQPIELGSAGH